MNAPATNLPATQQGRALHPVTKLTQQLEERASEFKKALPSHISPDKLQRTIVTAATNNPDLLTADRQSLIVSAMKAAQDGLLPDGREAALVIFNTRINDPQQGWISKQTVQYMPMVYGLRKKIVQSGEVVSLQTGLVYRAEVEAGAFIYEIGMEPPIRHRPMIDLPDEELTDDKIVAAYSIARMKDGSASVEVMRRGEINKVREASQTGATRDRKGNVRTPKGPWADWFGEMARKTVMRRHSKTLPMTGDIIIDVEGRDQEAAESTSRLLAVQPDAPVALPSRDELDEQVDPDTGEITTDSRGMTEISEEEARALDAGDQQQTVGDDLGDEIPNHDKPNDGTLAKDNPAATEGPSDEQRGEAQTEQQADFVSTGQPQNAKRNQTWFNPESGKLKYAHDKGEHGIKWYVAPQEDAADDKPVTEQQQDGPNEAQLLRDRMTDATSVDELDEAQAMFNAAKPRLKGNDITALRNLYLERSNMQREG